MILIEARDARKTSSVSRTPLNSKAIPVPVAGTSMTSPNAPLRIAAITMMSHTPVAVSKVLVICSFTTVVLVSSLAGSLPGSQRQMLSSACSIFYAWCRVL